MKEKVVLAYSGGLDTTAIIPWLKETFNYDVICCCIDCGQGEELDGLEERAKLSGAAKLYIEDIVDDEIEFIKNFRNIKAENNISKEFKVMFDTSDDNDLIIKMLKQHQCFSTLLSSVSSVCWQRRFLNILKGS